MPAVSDLPAEAVAAAAEAIAAQRRHLWDVDYCEVQALARAVLEAAAPHLVAAERERCAKLADEHNATYWKSCGRRECRDHHGGNAPFADLLRQDTP